MFSAAIFHQWPPSLKSTFWFTSKALLLHQFVLFSTLPSLILRRSIVYKSLCSLPPFEVCTVNNSFAWSHSYLFFSSALYCLFDVNGKRFQGFSFFQVCRMLYCCHSSRFLSDVLPRICLTLSLVDTYFFTLLAFYRVPTRYWNVKSVFSPLKKYWIWSKCT